MLFIEFCKHKLLGIKSFIYLIKNNRLIALTFAGILFAASTVASSLVDKATVYFFPQLDDSAAIIENQNKQFDLVKDNLQKLQSAISGKDREYLNNAFDTMKNIKTESDNLALRLKALQDENISLKVTLRSQKGVYGGVDVITPNNSGFKIDSQTSFGYRKYVDGALINLTTSNEEENIKDEVLNSGQGVYFTNENGKKCSLVFSSNTKVDGVNSALGNFVISCKK